MARTFEGRPLPRPADEVVDQGLGFDLGTLLSRRRILGAFGVGMAGLGLAACGANDGGGATTGGATTGGGATTTATTPPTTTGEIPDETAGPYPGDGSNGPDALEQSGIVRGDIRSSFGEASGTAEGVPMTLELTIRDLANGGAAYAGSAVYVWHCDREGRYSMYTEDVENENYLRGVQIAGADGRVRFTSVFPACYPGRWPHVHFEVYPDQAGITDSANAIATSQVALPEAACRAAYAQTGYSASVATLTAVTLRNDNVFGDDGGVSQLGTATGDASSGYTVSLVVGVDPTTTPPSR